MNLDYKLDVNREVVGILKKSISPDLRAVKTAVKILLLKSMMHEDTEDSETSTDSNE